MNLKLSNMHFLPTSAAVTTYSHLNMHNITATNEAKNRDKDKNEIGSENENENEKKSKSKSKKDEG